MNSIVKIQASTSIANLASEINAAHQMASKLAGEAIDHAKRAGELLIEVKEQLPHGQFQTWLHENVSVSVRQAQRYMAAALGKKLPVRAIANRIDGKSDTVSHLPEWLPKNGEVAFVDFKGEGDWLESLDDVLMVQEIGHAEGFYAAVYLNGSMADFTSRGIRSDFVEKVIFDWLPGRHSRGKGAKDLKWSYVESPNLVKEVFVDALNNMPQAA